jgi:hypothetical protein
MKKVGCCKCDETDVACLDYHHIDPKNKVFSLSCRVVRRKLHTILKESAKCTIVCSNCHRKHHYRGDCMSFNYPTQADIERRLRHAVEDDVITEKEFVTLLSSLPVSA